MIKIADISNHQNFLDCPLQEKTHNSFMSHFILIVIIKKKTLLGEEILSEHFKKFIDMMVYFHLV